MITKIVETYGSPECCHICKARHSIREIEYITGRKEYCTVWCCQYCISAFMKHNLNGPVFKMTDTAEWIFSIEV